MRRLAMGLAAALLSALAPAARAQDLVATGSGFLVNDAGWVLTNAHVVEGCDALRVERWGTALTVIRDAEADLALALFPDARGGTPLSLRKAAPRLAEPVVALGYPLTDILGPDIRVTTGTVSALVGMQGDTRFVQISAPVQPGNSGGPVLDADGHVLGIATATLAEGAVAGQQNVNFALTAREAVRFLHTQGLAYTVGHARADGAPAADPVGDAAGATALIECLGGSLAPPAPQAPPMTVSAGPPAYAPPPPPPSGLIVRQGMDVLGFDYATLRGVSLPACEAACEDDFACRAYTYNTRYGVCFLKDGAVVLVENEDAVGGFDARLADEVVDSGLFVRADVDSPGGDYRRVRDTDFVGCTLECGLDGQCRGFAFVRRTGDCWLKDRVGPTEPMPGVEFGRRR